MLKKMLLMISVILVMITSIAFSALSTSLAITSEVKFRPLADIRVNGIAMNNATGAMLAYDSDYSKNSVSNGFILPTTDSSISYRVHIDNTGDIDYSIYDIIRSASANGLNVAVDGYNITDVIRAKTSVDLLLTYTTDTPSESVINVVDVFDFKKVYHVTYETGTNEVIPAQVKYEGVDLNLTNTVPTKDGYSFVKWNTKIDGTGINYNSGAAYTQDEDLTLYARYSLNTYNINYVLNGGTNAIVNPSTYTIESNDIVLANATKEGYEFKGWTGNGTTTATKNLILPAGSFGDKTFTAHFEDETYPEITVTSIDGTKNYLTTPANINAGWNSTDGTLTYNINATDVGSGISKIEYAITNSATPPTTGWVETTNGDHSDVKSRGTYYIHVRATDGEDNVTVVTTKAQMVRYRLAYYDNYSKSTTVSENQYYAGAAVTTRTPTAVVGYTFDGWYNNANLNTKIVDANVVYTPPTSLKLFGKWNPITYSITYAMNNGTNSANNPSSYTIESNDIVLEEPTKTLTFKGNYNSTSGANASNGSGVVIGSNTTQAQTFAGWTGSNGNTPQTSVTIPTGSTLDKSYTAHWTAVAGTLPTVTREGYTCGWSTTSTGTTIVYDSGATYPVAAITEGMSATVNLYAVCNPNTYNISYTMNGGNNPNPKPTTGIYDADVVIGNPTKTFTVNINANGQGATIKNSLGTVVTSASSAQTFAGWSSTTIGSNALTGSSASNYSSWNGTTKTINTYFKNLKETGTVTMVANWTAVNVVLPNITKTGYTCGYATSSGGSIVYSSGGSYTPSITTNTATLYAVCNPNPYGISYVLNNGTSGANAPTSAIYDTDVVISNPTKTVTIIGDANGTGATVGSNTSSVQTFAGWSSTTIGSNALTGSSASNYSSWNGTTKTTNTYFKNLKETGTVTMVANWTPVSITLPTLSKTGYVCKWYTEPTGGADLGKGGTSYTPTANSATTITVYARCSEATDTPYRVNHYIHDLGANTYTLSSHDDLMGTTNATLTVANLKKIIPGFTYTSGYLTGNTTKPTSGAVTTTTILADGSRVINLYYRRNYLYVQYNVNGGTLNTTNTAYGVSNDLVTKTGNTIATNFLRGVYGSKVGAVDGSTYVVSSGLHNYNSSSDINIEREGYIAVANAEWNTNAQGTGTSYGQNDLTIDADGFAGVDLSEGDQVVTLYVHWTTSRYAITYAMNNGINNENNPSAYNFDSPTIALSSPTKTLTFKGNYNVTNGANASSGSGVVIGSNTTQEQIFAGWTGSNGNTPQTSVTIPTGSTGDKSYTAHWTAVAGTVPTITRTGYTCGWATTSTGTTIEIASGGSYATSRITEGMSSVVNLYAVCVPKTYTLTINPQGGTYNSTTNNSTKTMTYDSTDNNDIGVPTRSGYTFDGWYLEIDSKTNQLFNSTGKNTALTGYFSAAYSTGVWKHDGNVTVYAHWSKVISSLTNSVSPTSYIYDGNSKTPTPTVKDGNTTLNSGVDYTISYSNNTNVGTATATITGANVYNSTTKAYYTGTKAINFAINNAKLTFNVGSCENIVGTTTLYTRKNATKVYTGIQNSTEGTIPTASKMGYTFDGWYTANSGGSKVLNANGTFTGTAVSGYTNATSWQTVQDRILYARCTANDYVVTAHANGGNITTTTGWSGTGSTATKTVSYDTSYGTLPSVNKTGYTFNRWVLNFLEKPATYVTAAISNSVSLEDMIFIKAGTYTYSFEVSNATSWRPIVVLKDSNGELLTDSSYRPFVGAYYNNNYKAWLSSSNVTTTTYTITIVEDCYARFYVGVGDTSSSTTVNGYLYMGSSELVTSSTTVKVPFDHDINAEWTINNPATPIISGGTTKVYGSTATTLTCSTTTEYVSGTAKYYSFGYATSDGGTPTNWTTASTTNTLSIPSDAYVGQRWYSCRVYATDGTLTSSTVVSEANADTEMTINNAKITYNANSCGTISGTNPAYVKKGTTGVYTGIRNTTAGTIASVNQSGYAFNGWYSGNTKVINADGTIVANVSNWTDSSRNWLITEDKTLTASCTITGYSITYTMNNGVNNSNNPSAYDVESDPITLIAPTKTLTFKGNYNATSGANASSGSGVVIGSNTTQAQTFAGWSGTGITGNSTSVTIPTGSTGNRSYTAHWTAVAGTVPTITRTGYTCGWATTSTGTTSEIASGGSYATSRITEGMSSVVNLYAVCVPKTYTLTINPQGGTYNSTTNNSTKTMTYDSTDNNDIGVPTRSGYTFGGWYTAADGGIQVYGSNGQNVNASSYWSAAYSTGVWKYDGNVTLYAHWSKPVTLTTNSVSPTSYIYDGNSKTPTPTVKDGNTTLESGVDYTVSYSNNTNVGTATATITGANVYNSTTKAYYTGTSTVSYYINNAKLTFNAGNCASVNGTGTLYTRKNATKVYTGERNSTEGIVPTGTPQTGYVFDGWYTASTGGSKVLNANGTFTGVAVSGYTNATSWQTIANKDLYARCNIGSYTLTINPNGGTYNGTTSSTQITQDYGSTYNILNNPTKTGYIFAGWELTSGRGNITWYQDSEILKQYLINSTSVTKPNVYNNKGNGTVTLTNIADNTSSTGYSMRITTNGVASPGAGGFINNNTTTSGAIYYHKIVAKIPVGYSLAVASNSGGVGYGYYWITDNAGTGDWETYIYAQYSGYNGPFASFGHVYVNGSDNTNVTWYINESTIYRKGATLAETQNSSVVFEFLDSDATVTAKWSTSGSTVTWEKQNGIFGNGTVGNNWTANSTQFRYLSVYTGTKRAPYYISDSDFAFYRDGYTFDGWYTSADGGTKLFNADGSIIPSVDGYTDANSRWIKYDGNVTVYAHWLKPVTLLNNTISPISYIYDGNSKTPTPTVKDGSTELNSGVDYTVSYLNNTNVGTASVKIIGSNVYNSTTKAYYTEDTTLSYYINNAKLTFAAGSCANVNGTAILYTKKNSTKVYTEIRNTTEGTIPTASKSGYIFQGWYSASTGGSKVLNADGTFSGTAVANYTDASSWQTIEDQILYARCSVNDYTITYAMNNGINNSNNPDTYTVDSPTITLSAPTKTLTFKGNYNATSGANASSGSGVVIGSNTTQAQTFAGWSGTGITGNSTSVTIPTGSTGNRSYTAHWTAVAGTVPTITRTGYTCGWATTSTGTTIEIASGGSYATSRITEGMSSVVNLYAVCVHNVYTITLNNQSATTAGTTAIYEKYNTGYYLNNNNGTVSNQMTTSDNGITVPTRNGYTFGGYYTEANGSGTQYIDVTGKLTSNASTTQFTSNGTLYAKWTKNAYTVVYNNSCDLTASGSMSSSSHTYDTAKALTTNAYGCSATVTYNYNGATGGNSTTTATANASFLGWTVGGPNLLRNVNLSNSNNLVINENDGTFTISYDNTSGTSTYFGNFFYKTNANLITNTNYVYIADVKSINNTNAGNGYMSIYSSNVNTQLTTTTASKSLSSLSTGLYHANMTSASSFAESTMSLRGFVSIPKEKSASINFRPIVIQGTYNGVDLYYGDGSSVMNLATSGIVNVYTDWNEPSVTLPTPTKTGYTFGGWYSNSSLTTKVGNGGDKYIPSATGTLYAKWTINNPATPTITGGETKVYGSNATTLTCSTSTNYASGATKYYSFGYATSDGGTPSNWTTASTSPTLNISATEYIAQRWYSCRVYATDGTLTSSTVVSASNADTEMTINNAKLTFNAGSCNSVSGSTTLYTKKNDTKVYTGIRNTTVGTIPTASKSGYIFQGWYSASTGGSKVLNADGTFTGTAVANYTDATSWQTIANKDLYARCSMDEYSITYSMNNGINNENNPDTYTVDTPTITLQAPTKTLTFKGNPNATTSANAASGVVTIGNDTTVAQTFKGWTGSNGNTAQTSVTIPIGSTGNKSYTARWTSVTGALPTVTREGYVCGWNRSSTGTTIQYLSGATYPIGLITEGMSATVNLYAVCVVDTFELTLYPEGGTYPSTTPGGKNLVNIPDYVSTSSATIRNAESSKLIDVKYKDLTQYTISANITLSDNSKAFGVRARYTDESYEYLWLSSNGTYNPSVTTASGKTVKYIEFSYNSSTNVTMSNFQLEEGATATSYEAFVTQNTTTSTTRTMMFDQKYNNDIGVPTREGYTFAGWYTAANGGTQVYGSNGRNVNASGYFSAAYATGVWKKAEDTSLYAHWTKSVSTLNNSISPTAFVYNGNAQNTTPSVSDGETLLTQGVDYTTTFSNNINVGTARATITGANVYNATTKAYYIGETTLSYYINNATLTFNAGSCDIVSGTSPLYTRKGATAVYTGLRETTETGTIPTAIKPGNTFLGWYTAATDGSKILNADGTFTGVAVSGYTNATSWQTTGNKNLYAQCGTAAYTVTANANGGSISSTTGWTGTGNTAIKSVAYDSPYGTLPTVSRVGYEFNGWSLLPDGYTQVEYIESTGTQYIDTGYVPNDAGGKVETKVSFTSFVPVSSYSNIYGVEAAAAPWNLLGVRTTSAKKLVFLTYSDNYTNPTVRTENTAYTIEQSYARLTSTSQHLKYAIDGATLIDADKSSSYVIQQVNMYLFAANINGPTRHSKIKMYYFRLYDEDTLVREMVPCINDLTGKAGMYDLVNGVFYGNNGTGDFTAGNASYITSETIMNSPKNHTIYAKYTANTYTISYTMNNGPNPSTKPTTATYGEDVVISNPGNKTVTVTGNVNGTGATIGSATTGTQTFSGWTSSTVGSNALTSANASSYTAWTGTSTKNTHFKNLRESGTVTMVANWSGTVTLPTVSKSGSTCKWYTTSGTSGGSLMGNSGATWTIPSNSSTSVTAYARCTANQYTLTLKPNGGVFNGSTSNVVVTQEYGTTYEVSNTPTREGYNFTGWKLSGGNGTYGYIEDSSVTPMSTSTLTYNASNSTKPTAYNNAGGGTVTNAMVSDPTATGGYSLNVVTNGTASPGAGGIYFNLWPTVPNRVNVLIVRAKIPTGYSLKLGGVGSSYTGYGSGWVTYDGTGSGDWKTYYISVFAGTTGTVGERIYMYLDGTDNTSVSWNVDSISVKSYTREQYKTIYTFGAGNAQLTAQWNTGGAKVTWDKQGGTFGNGTIGNKWTAAASYFTYTTAYSDTKKAPYYISDSDFAIYKTGYTLVGWYTAATGGTQVFDATGKLNANVSGYSDADRKWQKYDENVTLYARWSTDSYTVTYNTQENGGTGTIDSTTVAYGDAVPLPTTGASKAGWTFVGWNTDKNATSALSSLTMGSDDITLYAIYRKEAISLTANWNANGATLSSSAQSTCSIPAVYNNNTQATSCTVTAPTITRANYDIIGWNQSASATTNDSSYNTSTGKLTLTSSNTGKTWYAITKAQTVLTATFAANNGATVSANSASCYLYGTSTSCKVNVPSVTVQTGFNHIGFNTNANANANNTNYNPTTGKLEISANSTWYPITESNSQYTASFIIQDTNAVNQTNSSVSCYRYNGATSCNIQSPLLTAKGNYIIVGWGLSETSTEAAYANGATISLSANATFYSITYLDEVVTITFNRNSNNSMVISQTPYEGTLSTDQEVTSSCVRMNGASTCSITSPTVEVLTGYHAVGYNTNATSTSSTWNVNTQKAVSSNATYYAITAGNSYSIKFNANCPAGLTATGSMSNLAMTYGTAKNLTPNAFGCAGRVFRGWTLNANGTGTTFSDGESVSNLTPTDGATVNLYGKWRYIDPTPTISGGTTKIYGVSSTTLTCSENTSYPSGTIKYYAFGYTTSNGGTPSNWTEASTTNTLSISSDEYVGTRYYSCRVYVSNGSEESDTIVSSPTTNNINNAKITFNAENCGTISGTSPAYVNNSMTGVYIGIRNTTVGTMPSVSKSGYTFEGWYDENTMVVDNEGTIVDSVANWTDANKKWLITTNKTLSAHCSRNNYTITYALNNGTVTPANPGTYHVESDPITLRNPAKTLTFKGNYNATSGANASSTSGVTIGASTTKAQPFLGWSGTGLTGNNNTSVTIPTGSTGNRSYTAHYTADTTTTPTVTRTGYICGWNRSNTGTTKEIESGATFPINYISESMSSTVNLYAVCSPKTYTINYSCGADTTGAPPTPGTATYNSMFTVATNANTCQKEGYVFAGWKDSTDVNWTNWSGTWVYDNGQYGIENDSMTLTAQWIAGQYSVTCEDYFVDASNNLKVLLGSNSQSFNYGVTVSGATWGTNADLGTYYQNYKYVGSSADAIVPTNNNLVVYRYFHAKTDLNIYYADRTTQGGATVSFKVGDGSWNNVDDEEDTIQPWGTTYYLKNISPKNATEEFDSVSNLTWDATNSHYYYTPTAAGNAMKVYLKYKIYPITLDKQSGSSGTSTIYSQYNTGYYLDSAATTQITTTSNGVTIPTRTGYTFGGYYTAPYGEGTQYITSTGKLNANASTTHFTAGGTLYAYWYGGRESVRFDYFDDNTNQTFSEWSMMDTYYKPDWSKSFDMSIEWEAYQASGKKVMLISNYNTSTANDIEIEVTTDNRINIWVGTRSSPSTNVTFGSVPRGQRHRLDITWNGTTKQMTATISGAGSGSWSGTVNGLTGLAARNLRIGMLDYREGSEGDYTYRGSINISDFTITEHYISPSSEAITVPDPASHYRLFNGWTGNNGTTPQYNLTVPAGTKRTVTYTANWSAASSDYHLKEYRSDRSTSNQYIKYKFEVDLSYIDQARRKAYTQEAIEFRRTNTYSGTPTSGPCYIYLQYNGVTYNRGTSSNKFTFTVPNTGTTNIWTKSWNNRSNTFEEIDYNDDGTGSVDFRITSFSHSQFSLSGGTPQIFTITLPPIAPLS